jgi:hypothetical protein
LSGIFGVKGDTTTGELRILKAKIVPLHATEALGGEE